MDFKGIIIIFLALFCVIISQGHGIVFFDDFNDNIFDSTSWAVWLGGEATGELEESDSVLQLRLPPECLGRMCLVSAQTKRVFSGDFDVQVDYDIVVCSPSDHVACFLRILPECLLSPTVAIYWSHSWYSDTDYVAAYAMIGDSVWRPVDWDETLDSEGSFRITRSGDTFGFYYGSLSGWVPITTYTLPMGQVRVALQIQHEDIWLADYEVHFDNFYVQADSIGYIGCTPPEVSRLCLNEFIEIMISEDDDSVYPPSIDISVNGINYDISSPQLIYTRGTEILTFFSVPPWDEGDSNEVCVNHVENYMGDAFLDTVCWSFVVDTTPPVMVEYFPPADTMTFDVRTPIWVHLEDLYHPILNGTLQLNVNGFNYGVMHPFIDWDSTTITFDISGSAFEFPRAESVEVCINYADNITFCPSNEGSFCWRFFVGDSIPPEFDIIEPLNGYVTACDDQQIFIRMTDNIAFDCSTVILEINGIQYSYPDGMDYSDSLLSFTAPLNWADYETVDVCITEGRDIFGISFRDLPFCWSFIVDLSGPFYRDFSPGAGETIQLAQPVISVYIEDYYTEVRTEDMLVFIDIQGGDSFTLDTSQFSWNDTLLIVSTESNGIRFSGGEEITVCIHAYDTPDYCSSNLGDTCWTFFIVSGGPRAEALLPLNNEITACSDQAIFISLLDSNGVQESTILLTVEGESFRTTSDELTYIN
ncbi:hypothetical protein JW877_03045, partial [bacterium]|nr:hypothetical protein [bacterium]